MIDLHTHSNLSDGTLSPNDLILYAKRRGIETLAIADHETISNFKKYSKFAEKNGVKMIPAVEINAGDFKNFHLVAYGVQDLETLENIFNKIKIENVKVCSKVLERLKTDYGIELSESEVLKFSASGILDKRAIAKALIDKGFAPDTKSVYDNYIGQGAKSYVPIKKLFAKDIIKTVHELGGIVVWAHPSTVRKIDNGNYEPFSTFEEEEFLKQLVSFGLDGIECYTAKTTENQETHYMALAKKYGLVVSGGSDFHNHFKQELIGSPKLTKENVKILEDKIKQIQSENSAKNCFGGE